MGSGFDPEKGLVFGLCNHVTTQLEGPNIKVLAFEAAREKVLAAFATLQRRVGLFERRAL